MISQRERRVGALIEIREGVDDRALQRFHAAEEVVVERRALQVTPQPFDQIELGAVAGQPDYQYMVGVVLQQRQDGTRAVIAGVVDDQYELALAVELQQLPQEVLELLRVFPGVHQVVRLPGAVVHRAVDAQPLVDSGGGDDWPDSAQRPDLGQGRVEMNLTFVEVEQVKGCVRCTGPFFTNSRNAFLSSYSFG